MYNMLDVRMHSVQYLSVPEWSEIKNGICSVDPDHTVKVAVSMTKSSRSCTVTKNCNCLGPQRIYYAVCTVCVQEDPECHTCDSKYVYRLYNDKLYCEACYRNEWIKDNPDPSTENVQYALYNDHGVYSWTVLYYIKCCILCNISYRLAYPSNYCRGCAAKHNTHIVIGEDGQIAEVCTGTHRMSFATAYSQGYIFSPYQYDWRPSGIYKWHT